MNMPPVQPACPVCLTFPAVPLARIEMRDYWRCATCEARFLDPAQRPSAATERSHYAHHRNDPGDPAYRAFLSKLAAPLLATLGPGASGLDYGCGPGPALAAMLGASGHDVALYDPIYFPDTAPLAQSHDFICCTETAEHFHDPAREFARFQAMLRPGGWLAVMTCFQTDDERFAAWYYRRDPTHVVFYREATFHHIAASFGWSCAIPVKDVALMQKPR